MQDFEFESFLKAMVVVAETYDKELSQERMTLYFGLLKPYELEEITMALKHHIKGNKFFPTPAHIIEIIRSHRLVKASEFPQLPPPREFTKAEEVRMDKALLGLAEKMGRLDWIEKLKKRIEEKEEKQ